MTPRIARCALALTFFLPSLGARAETIFYDFRLTSTGAVCNPDADVSCVRYNGDTALYPDGFRLRMEADFDSQVGNVVPLSFPNFFIPDVQRFGELVEIDTPAQIEGFWNVATGELSIDAAPVDFPGVVLGGAQLDPFELTTNALPGDLFCAETIPPMAGFPTLGGMQDPGFAVLVARDCVQGPGLNETFFVVLAGTLEYLPEPGSSALAGAAALALGTVASTRRRRRSRRGWRQS